MRVFHVDRSYINGGEIYYYVMPYSLKGTWLSHFGFTLRPFGWRIGYIPWYSRFTLFFEWVKLTYLTREKAEKKAQELNERISPHTATSGVDN